MSSSIICHAVTSSAYLSYIVDICCVPAGHINKYSDKSYFDSLCRVGCSNYNKKWSCPPHSPDYREFSNDWKNLYILYISIELSQFSYIKNDYLKIKAANSILKSRADKFLRYIAANYGTYISTGSCRMCKPCKYKQERPCALPELMTYSFEAMGVNVGKLVMEQFGKPLLWYKKDCLPEYTSVVCGLLTNTEILLEKLKKEYLQHTQGLDDSKRAGDKK